MVPLIMCSTKACALLLAVSLWIFAGTESCGPGRAGARRRSPKKLTPLVYKEHVPNVYENTVGASGQLEHKLTRSHPKFKELVPNYNPDIVFVDDEGDGSDRLMSKRCKEKLNALAISVMNQYPGVKLRVTEAWDEEDVHGPSSLHFEGRAVDITTSDRDRSKYGMLARLAIEAGFDWVYYKSRSHIHASVKSESSDAARTGGCFHGNGLVQTPNGTMKMSELVVGDQVLVVGPEGYLEYSEVSMFLDRDESQHRLYQTIETEFGSTITLTPSHLIYVSYSDETDDITQGVVIFARDLELGYYIYVNKGGNTSSVDARTKRTTLERIVRVTTSTELGVYAPLTSQGNIIVNNVVASCYAVFNEQTLAHLAFLPVRIVQNFKSATHHLFQTINIAKRKKRKDTMDRTNHQQIEIGIHWYPKLIYSLGHKLLPQRFLYH